MFRKYTLKDNKTILVIPPDTDVDVVVIREGKTLTLNVHIAILKDGNLKVAQIPIINF